MRKTTAERFWAKVHKTDTCWLWIGARSKNGYGNFWSAGHMPAHRWSYGAARGQIPEDMVIDHLCRNRLCVNPAHLEVVTNRENIYRGECPAAKNRRKVTCKRGHENWRVRPTGGRTCRTCEHARQSAA